MLKKIDKFDILFLLLMLVFSAFFLYTISGIKYVGYSDAPIYVIEAENLATEGKFENESVHYFYNKHSSVRHFEDNWQPLQQFLIAIFFFFLGTNFFVAELTNYFIFILLLMAIYYFGSKIFNKKAALLGVFFLLLNRLMFEFSFIPLGEPIYSLLVFIIVVSFFLYCKNREKIYLFLLFVSASLLAFVRTSAIIFVPILLLVGFLEKDFKQKKYVLVTVALLLGLSMLLPFIVFLKFGYMPAQPPLHLIFKVSDCSGLGYAPIFGVYFDSDPIDLTSADSIKAFAFCYFRDIGRFFRDLLTQSIFSTLVVFFFFLSMFSENEKLKRLSRLSAIFLFAYMLIMLVMGHYEQRYPLIFAPLLSLCAATACLEFFGMIKDKKGKILYVSVISLMILITIFANLSLLLKNDQFYMKPGGRTETILESLNWLKNNTTKDAVIMSRHPAAVAYHSERLGVMNPYGDWATKLYIAKHYKADYIWLPNWEFPDIKEQYKDFYEERQPDYFVKVYDSHPDGSAYSPEERIRIFKIDWEKINMDEFEKPGWYD